MIDRKLMHIAFHAPYGLDPARPAPPSQPRKPMTKDVQDLSKHTPMMQQYWKLKREHPDHLMFFRVGDFYELLYEEARIAANLLYSTLTARGQTGGTAVPMAGIPFPSAEGYLSR